MLRVANPGGGFFYLWETIMARHLKETIDYFPHIIKNGKTMFILESKYGNNGYAFWFKLLELLGSSNNQIYDYNNPADWEFLLAKTKVDAKTAIDILETLANVGAIDKKLLEKKVIWSENFIKNIEDVYKRRKQEKPQKPIIVDENPINANKNPINANKSAQTKLNKTKLNNKEIEIFWDYYLSKVKKKFKLTSDKKALIKKKLGEGYTLEQLKQAVDRFAQDDWDGRQSHLDLIYCIGKQQGKPDNLEKWLNKPKSMKEMEKEIGI